MTRAYEKTDGRVNPRRTVRQAITNALAQAPSAAIALERAIVMAWGSEGLGAEGGAEADAVAAVERANRFDRAAGGVAAGAVQQEHR
jgi:hypothetical protein